MYKKRIGDYGEKFAVGFLEAKGYEILERDFRTKFGQVDVIARNTRVIHFIEVKTRSSVKYGRPAEAVNQNKINHIRNVAMFYIKTRRIKEPVIIDVMEILVNHIEGV